MDKIYQQAKDKNVAAVIIYGKSGDAKAYTDAACTKPFKTTELTDAFNKRGLVQIGTDFFVPITFAVGSGVGTLTYAKAGSASGTAETATLISVAD